MAWRCSGKTNGELIENLFRNGLITSTRVRDAMLKVSLSTNQIPPVHSLSEYHISPSISDHPLMRFDLTNVDTHTMMTKGRPSSLRSIFTLRRLTTINRPLGYNQRATHARPRRRIAPSLSHSPRSHPRHRIWLRLSHARSRRTSLLLSYFCYSSSIIERKSRRSRTYLCAKRHGRAKHAEKRRRQEVFGGWQSAVCKR